MNDTSYDAEGEADMLLEMRKEPGDVDWRSDDRFNSRTRSVDDLLYVRFWDDVYNARIHLVFGNTDFVDDWVAKHGPKPYCDEGLRVRPSSSFYYDFEDAPVPEHLIWMEDQGDWRSFGFAESLIHEVTHYCSRVLTNVGIDIRQSNSEILAYHIGYIFKKIRAYTGLYPALRGKKGV